MSNKTKLPERKALVHAAKNMNEVLGLNPKIRTKVDDELVPEKEIAAAIVKAANGWNEKKGKFIAADAVSRDNDDLSEETWEVLEQLGAVEPVKSGKKDGGKKSKKDDDEDEAPKGKKSVKESLKGSKDEPKGSSTRGAGLRATDFKTLRKSLEAYEGETVTTLLNKLLLTKQTLGEHIAQAKKEFGYTGSLPSHIKYCYEALGYDFIDKRKHKSDADGIVQLIGMSPDEAKKRTLELGTKEDAEPKGKKSKKDDDEDEAPKGKKSDKKAKKDEDDEDDEPKSKKSDKKDSGKKDKKSKKSDDDE